MGCEMTAPNQFGREGGKRRTVVTTNLRGRDFGPDSMPAHTAQNCAGFVDRQRQTSY